ncbi:MAG: TlpA disulfide reductase family protein [Agriterribacter sp.]
MRLLFQILLLCCISLVVKAQVFEFLPITLNVGDPAPPLRIKKWLKGEPVIEYKKGTVYIIEFWATWCVPCKAAMPRLSALANKYRDKVTVIGISIMESKKTSVQKISAFVDSMGQGMDYNVATEDSNFVQTDWMLNAEERGIPKSFIINNEGLLAWIGHPSKIEEVLPDIINNNWDIAAELSKRISNRNLLILDDSLNYDLMNYLPNRYKPKDKGQPDSALAFINKIIITEPKLKYTPHIAYTTIWALLKTDPEKAYAYGKELMITPTYEDPPYWMIYRGIEAYVGTTGLPLKFYQLGAEAYKTELESIVYPELMEMYKRYSEMAKWYWRAKDKSNALIFQQKAIDFLKNTKDFSKTALATLEKKLQQYKIM